MDSDNENLSNEDIMESHKSKSMDMEEDLDIDVGTLLASNYNALDMKALKSQQDLYLKNLTKKSLQLLVNKIWKLPIERVDETIVAMLPKPEYVLPRSQGIPKPKPLTKWERYAKEKGIQKRKKSKLKWDEQLKKFIPTYGYRRAKAQEQTWAMEAKDGENQDNPFAKAKLDKLEKRSKNELQRLRNIAKAKNIKLPRVGLPTTENFPNCQQLSEAVTVARMSTASVGKFQDKLPKEKDAKGIAKEIPGMKRKRKGAPLNITDEKRRNKSLVDDVLKSQIKLIRDDYSTGTTDIKQSTSGNKKKKMVKKQKGGKKPKAGKGERNLHKKVGGRKRR